MPEPIHTPPGADLPHRNEVHIAVLTARFDGLEKKVDDILEMVTDFHHVMLNDGQNGIVHQIGRAIDAVKRRLGSLEEWRKNHGPLQPHPMRREGDVNRPADKVPGRLTMYFRSIPFHAWVIIGLLGLILLLLPPEMWARVHEIASWFRGGSP